MLGKVNELTKEDWEDSLNELNQVNDTVINTNNAANASLPLPFIAYFSPDEKELIEKVEKAYTKITGQSGQRTNYANFDQLKNDTTLPKPIKQELLINYSFPFDLLRLQFYSQQQYAAFIQIIPEEAKNKFNELSTLMLTQTNLEQEANYCSPSPFNMRPF